MHRISIIYTYKNRDTLRVMRCFDSLTAQTFQDFEVIFIDNGSDEQYSREIEPLVNSYSFARYIRLSTEGYPWNKSHAINVALRLIDSEYILLGDIDLVYSPFVLEMLNQNASPEIAFFSPMFLLSKGFKDWNCLFNIPLSKIRSTEDSPIGAVLFVYRKVLMNIQGFDEYYCFWGVEDRDIVTRIEKSGIRFVQIDKFKYPIFHQWHPIVSDRKKRFFPEKWWDEINIYYSLNKDKLIRNDENWGKLTRNKDRPIFNANVAVSQTLSNYGKSYQKSEIKEGIIPSIISLKEDDCIEIVLLKRKRNEILFYLIKYQNLICRKLNLPLGVDYIENVESEKYFYPEKDIFYVIWQIIQKKDFIRDYEIIDMSNKLIIRMMKKV